MPAELIISAFVLDMILGEPAYLPHPVQLIGLAVSRLETALGSAAATPSDKRSAGIILVAIVVSATFIATLALVHLSYSVFGKWGGGLVSVYLAYTTLSARGLANAAILVRNPLAAGDLDAARAALSRIVGRDTENLDTADTARGAVETVAENSADGIIAPLFYLAIGGPALAMAYKAVNTLDSMVGYQNEKYTDLGRAAARLDDIANYVPARIAAVCMVAASVPLGYFYTGRFSASDAWRIFLRDRKNHPSPNSGCPESAAAGSLEVRLGGPSSYFGKTSNKPYIGDPLRAIGADTISAAVILMYTTALTAVIFFAWMSYIFYQ